jgi:hypothetical protein
VLGRRGQTRRDVGVVHPIVRLGIPAAQCATLRKDKRVNIRISEKDLLALQKRAVHQGIPYQTLISSVLHKYVNGGFTEK